ncbi:MAG: class I SAM-dependent methyltransferase [Alphaproteobacteria bacterium]|nr:class I SAM-dependent methyltransferase [Alphaproteobacteria bacterium]
MGPDTLIAALERRAELLDSLDDTDCVRLLHGIVEGWPGVAVDRYGPVLLVQTWREPLAPGMLEALAAVVPFDLVPVWNHRAGGGSPGPVPDEAVGTEHGVRFDVRPRHRGSDPLLFLDFRVARRWIRGAAGGRSVLNLFAYTCGMGVAAAVGGATRVLNVDFAASSLDVGRANAALNGVEMGFVHDDVHPVVRQLAGLPVGGRRGRQPRYTRVSAELFDIVVLDPPRWARSAWGAVDVVRDYPSLFKPALLATAPGGCVLATNHVPTVPLDAWLAILERTAAKAGRPLAGIDVLEPDADFPSFDGQPPLKIAVCRV